MTSRMLQGFRPGSCLKLYSIKRGVFKAFAGSDHKYRRGLEGIDNPGDAFGAGAGTLFGRSFDIRLPLGLRARFQGFVCIVDCGCEELFAGVGKRDERLDELGCGCMRICHALEIGKLTKPEYSRCYGAGSRGNP